MCIRDSLVAARRPAASAIKPFVYAAALENGTKPCDYLDNSRKTYAEFDDWAPDNFDRDTIEGEVAVWYALALSLIHISEPTRLLSLSYAVLCMKKKKKKIKEKQEISNIKKQHHS